MALAKTSSFEPHQTDLARIAKALSHPARVAIIEYLLRTDACMCGDIVEVLPLSQSTVSQHLKELKSSGLIKGTVDGPKVCYCIDEEAWQKAGTALGAFLQQKKQIACMPGKCC